ncbi:MAG TPA: tetratricopeptide repeat protein [Candidatus Uhrbacteria bacterium]|nr:tetratricopeptide repeat protein [Candidatus Uhrbacteria bacterium]
MYNILALIIILICLGIILAIVVRKMPILASFDVNEIPEEKNAKTKDKIIGERLQRKAKFLLSKVSPAFKKATSFSQLKIKSINEKLKELEEKYRKRIPKEDLVTKEDFEKFEKNIDSLLAEAESFADKDDYEEAEKKYIEIIGLDSRNIEAYHGLGDVYFMRKNYDEARQTFEHILKLNKIDGKAFFKLAELYCQLENYEHAMVDLAKALEIEPNNPKYLDLLVKICIILKDKKKAKEALLKLREVNPENKKIADFEIDIKKL